MPRYKKKKINNIVHIDIWKAQENDYFNQTDQNVLDTLTKENYLGYQQYEKVITLNIIL